MKIGGIVVWLTYVWTSAGHGERPSIPDKGPQKGCLSLKQVEHYIRATAEYVKGITKLEVVGRSVENRELLALCVGKSCSESPGKRDNVPEAFINGLHHARECVSMMSVLHSIEHILEAYEQSEDWAKHLVHTRRIWFFPVVNPDGYAWNEKTHPNGGGFHRKNRRRGECNNEEKLGVDLNRNYPVCFDHKDMGASGRPCEEDYRGPHAFSEPETQAIKTLIEARNFTTALNIHSYGRLMLVPYSCQKMGYPDTKENDFYLAFARSLASVNHFVVGRPYEKHINMYWVNGDAADWMYRKHSIYAVSPEVGGGGFWPNSNKVKELSEENVPMVLHASLASGTLLQVPSVKVGVESSSKFVVQIKVENAGLWHSIGDVVVVGVLDHPDKDVASPIKLSLGSIPYKYGSGAGQIELSFGANPQEGRRVLDGVNGIKLHIYDSLHCVGYFLQKDKLPGLGSNAAVDLDLDNHVYVKRFVTRSKLCLSSLFLSDSELSDNSTNIGVPEDQSQMNRTESSFGRLSGQVQSLGMVILPALVLLSLCLGCLLARTKPSMRYAKLGEASPPEGDAV